MMTAAGNEIFAPPVLQPLNNVAVRELPAEFRDLLDPAKPLTAEEFAPEISSLPLWGIAVLPCVPLVGGLIEILRRPEISAAEIKFGLIFGFPLFAAAAALLYFANRKSNYKRRVESGELRIGLFIHKDALLVRTSENSCSLLPKDFLRSVILDRYAHAKSTPATKITFVDHAGNHYANIAGINSFGIIDRLDHYHNLADALRRWKPELEVVEKA